MGLLSEPLALGRVEEGPQQELWPTGPLCDFAQAPSPKDFDQRLPEPEEE